MPALIRGGTIIDADRTYRADVLCADPQDGGTILAIGQDLEAPAGAQIVVRAASTSCLAASIRTRIGAPFMGTKASDDFCTGTAAGLAGGTPRASSTS